VTGNTIDTIRSCQQPFTSFLFPMKYYLYYTEYLMGRVPITLPAGKKPDDLTHAELQALGVKAWFAGENIICDNRLHFDRGLEPIQPGNTDT